MPRACILRIWLRLVTAGCGAVICVAWLTSGVWMVQKSPNILLSHDYRAKIADVGIARVLVATYISTITSVGVCPPDPRSVMHHVGQCLTWRA